MMKPLKNNDQVCTKKRRSIWIGEGSFWFRYFLLWERWAGTNLPPPFIPIRNFISDDVGWWPQSQLWAASKQNLKRLTHPQKQLCEDSMKSFMHEQERLARQQTWRTTTNGEHWKLWSSGQRRLWTSVKRNQKLWLHRFLSSSDNAKTISESANTLLLELSQWFVCSPEAFRDGATLGLIANPVLTTTKSIDGGSLGCQTDAAGMSHWDAASRLLVYLCKFAPINQL